MRGRVYHKSHQITHSKRGHLRRPRTRALMTELQPVVSLQPTPASRRSCPEIPSRSGSSSALDSRGRTASLVPCPEPGPRPLPATTLPAQQTFQTTDRPTPPPTHTLTHSHSQTHTHTHTTHTLTHTLTLTLTHSCWKPTCPHPFQVKTLGREKSALNPDSLAHPRGSWGWGSTLRGEEPRSRAPGLGQGTASWSQEKQGCRAVLSEFIPRRGATSTESGREA